MDKSRGFSSEANSYGKRRLERSGDAGPDLAYEAELGSKLETEHVMCERATVEREAWVAGPAWL